MKKIYMYLLNTMADWETGYVLQGLAMQNMLKAPKYQLRTVANSKKPIKTAGGMTLIPDCTFDQIVKDDIAALLLPGADTWLEKEQEPVLKLSADLISNGILVAAICGATLGLADIGILNTHFHTSNALFFLTELSKNYKGKAFYKEDVAVTDRNLVTASSAGGLLWARRIFEHLELYPSKTIEAWYHYFATGDVKYYGELMDSLK